MDLPPEDRERSPHTGWARAHWERVADALLAAVRPFATPRHALVHLPGPESRSGRWSDGLEGFARTFVLAAFRGDAEWHADGLAAGSDPGSAERWPRPDEIPQARVEAACIALGLHESGLWGALDERVREQLVEWLGHMRRAEVGLNNWVWFRAIVSAFLRSVGAEWEPADLEEAAERTEGWYRGAGWYTDGAGRNFDYYNAWALHFYPLWVSRVGGELPAERHRERLRRFLEDAQHLVGADGAPLLQGRSLTYRFAMLAPFWTGALFEATPLTPGRTRRLASGVLRHFLDAGCLDERGLLPIGWHRAFPAIRQTYSGPGSPYWAAKGFAGLVLPPDHPVWTAPEEPLELEAHDVERVIRAPGWLVSGTRADGIVRLANHGTAKGAEYEPFYSRWAYATHASPQVAGEPVDSHVALLDEHGRPSHREPPEILRLGARHAVSRSGTLVTAAVLHGPWEVRLARADAPGGRRLRIGGSGVPAGGPPSAVLPLRGLDVTDRVRRYGADPLGDPATVPVAETSGPALRGFVYAALVTLGRADGEVAVAVHDETVVTVRFPDGELERVELLP